MEKKLAKIVLAILIFLPVCANATIVDITVATDKPTYQVGEYVTVSITAYNPNPEPVTLNFPTSMQASYLMDNIYNWKDHHGAYLELTNQQIEGLSSHTWTLVNVFADMQTYPLAVGTHTVVGEVIGYGSSLPVQFEVVPEPATLVFLAIGLPIFRILRRK